MSKAKNQPIILMDEYEIPCPKCKKPFWEFHNKYDCLNGYKVNID